jgi:hypothetical protein
MQQTASALPDPKHCNATEQLQLQIHMANRQPQSHTHHRHIQLKNPAAELSNSNFLLGCLIVAAA